MKRYGEEVLNRWPEVQVALYFSFSHEEGSVLKLCFIESERRMLVLVYETVEEARSVKIFENFWVFVVGEVS